jgi:tetratricopeptide (TPR) repeat protein
MVVVLVLVAPQCRKEKAQAPEPGPKPAAPAAPVAEEAGKVALEQAAKASVFDINALLERHEPEAALRLATSSVERYADTAAGGELQRLKQKAEEALRAVPKPAPTPLPAPPPAPAPAGGVKKAETPRAQSFIASRDAGIAAMNAGDYARAVSSFQAALNAEDDPAVRALLQKSVEMSGPPALVIAEFEVGEDVGIPDAGTIVADALFRQFDPQRFRLVDRAVFASLLREKNLDPNQVFEDPLILRDQDIRAVRYLVLGRVSRIGALLVTARLIDAATGDEIQTAEVLADDENGLLEALPELAAMLQMTDDEKTAFVDRREAGLPVENEAARIAEERLAAEQSFQARQHGRDALSAVTEIRMAMARGDLERARQYAAWAAQEFADTGALQEIDDLRVVIEREIGERREEDLRRIHERFLRLRDRGRVEMANGNIDEAIRAFDEALRLEDDPYIRRELQTLRLPGLAVPDFDVTGNVGLANPGRTLAGYLLERVVGDSRRYRAVERPYLDKELRRLGLTHADAVRNPADILLRRMRGVRYLVLGQARQGSIELTASFYDLTDRRLVQTAEVTVRRSRDLQRGLDDLAKMLQMPNEKRRVFADQLRARNQMDIGDEAAAARRWQEASDAYQEAYRISGDRRALDKKKSADRMLGEQDGYAKAIAEGNAARGAGRWAEALDAYTRAAGLNRTPAAVAEVGRAKQGLYDAVMAAGRAAEQTGDWPRALGTYEMAVKVNSTADARTAVTRVTNKLKPEEPKGPTPFEQAMAEGNAARDAGKWQEALDAYNRAIGLNRTPAGVTAVGQAKRSLYDAVMAEGRAAEQAGDWQRALGAYQMAVKVNGTPEARTAVTRMTLKIKPPEPAGPTPFEQAIAEGNAARDTGKWQEALDAYNRATGLNRSPTAVTSIAQAKRGLYDAVMAEGRAAEQAGDWPRALGAYEMAGKVSGTPEARTAVTRMTLKIKPPEPAGPTPFEQRMAEGNTARDAGKWQEALDAYNRAIGLNRTPAAVTAVGQAKKGLYDAVMAEGRAAEQAGDWPRALGAYEMAVKINGTPEARTAVTRMTLKIKPPEPAGPTPFEQAMAEGNTAMAAKDWQAAQVAYARAASATRNAMAQVELGKRRRALYDAVMAEGRAAEEAGDWPKAVKAYEIAVKVLPSADARTALERAKKKGGQAG